MDAMLKVVVDQRSQARSDQGRALRAGNNILEPLRYTIAKTELEAKFSVPFLMSAIILQRKRRHARVHRRVRGQRARAQQMMPRVTAVHDMEIEKQGFDKIRSVVEVDLVDGRKLVQPSDDRYRGGPDNPFSRDDLKAQVRATARSLVLCAGSADAGVQRDRDSVDSMTDIRRVGAVLSTKNLMVPMGVLRSRDRVSLVVTVAAHAQAPCVVGHDRRRCVTCQSLDVESDAAPSGDSEVLSWSLRVGTAVDNRGRGSSNSSSRPKPHRGSQRHRAADSGNRHADAAEYSLADCRIPDRHQTHAFRPGHRRVGPAARRRQHRSPCISAAWRFRVSGSRSRRRSRR